MKKIISTMAAVAMLVSCFVTTSFAAVTAETPAKLVGSLTKIDTTTEEYETNYAELCADYVDMGLDIYSLKISVANSPASVSYASMGSKYTGTTITYFSAQLPITTDAVLDDTYCFIDKTGAAIVDNGILKYAEDGNPIASLAKQSLTEGSTASLVETILAIMPGKTFSLSWKAAEVGTQDFAAAKLPTADTYKGYILNANDGLLVLDASSVSGMSIPAGGDDNDDDDQPTTVEKAAKATTPYKTGLKGIKFFVTTDDVAVTTNKTVEKVVEFTGNTFVEGGDVSVGLKVTGVPSTVTLTITAEDWYGNN